MNFDAFVECKINTVSVVETTEGDNVLIYIIDHENNQWLLTASTVSDLLLNEMRLQNIIDRINLFDKNNIEDVREKIFYLLRGRNSENKEELAWEGVEKVVKNTQASKSVFLEIEAVYGAYVLLIAKDIVLSRCEEKTNRNQESK